MASRKGVFELRPVERALARIDARLHAAVRRQFVEHAPQRGFGLVPRLIAADALLRPRRQLHHDILEAEVLVDRHDEVVDLHRIVHDLVFGAEDMRIVLREGAHAHHAVQRARRLVAMHDAELGDLHRQVAIDFSPCLKICTWPGQFIGFSAKTRSSSVVAVTKHVLAIPAPVAGCLPQGDLSSTCGALTSI
jgi:hypothetical protein